MRPWRSVDGQFLYLPAGQDVWDQLRSRLQLGQQLTGTVVWVPNPRATGIGVDVDLPIGGFVDVFQLPHDTTRWPVVGTQMAFYVWWMDDRPQIRLLPADPHYRREDFDEWVLHEDTLAAAAYRAHHGTG
ncbi:hypothetical protein [Microbispora triticiradicis]|uniref:S1 motif domain-containing protein n=2 Tax=Microbispora TaxID=2005 RepID=A0ABY3LMN8_9ACTN|nr:MULTISPECIES: hypothetical protein [Microbispora]TLP54507.1 hypothetical protein FED44_27485 [Microbispora fusca]TYB41672.1 hypothetical protein FXF59_35155 [Microbispora tritici]